ncbi:hypothetical protein OsJ_13481 [Oryza sativa Japonica Group]|uniref:Uncharacterized protein n=1 Tax=Oryza sativa subsp. japonica TaxID=39947 RepID=B9F821_ORYSJ|nr:hypothetical protein OsJ_13481 [Oryza sativa Japonica Group]
MLTNGVVAAAAIITGNDLSSQVFYGSWKCSSTVLISEGDAVSDGVRTRHKGWIMINGRG